MKNFYLKKKDFYNKLTMNEITDEEYENVKLFYKKMKFKNLREYLRMLFNK